MHHTDRRGTHRPRRLHRAAPPHDRAHAESDQHQRGEKFEGQCHTHGHRQSEQHQRATDEQHAGGMPHAPRQADQCGAPQRSGLGHDRADGRDVVRVGRVADAQGQSEREGGKDGHAVWMVTRVTYGA